MDRGSLEIAKRREFGAFLKSRRARLKPEDVGLGAGTRRRTPGLRREEVAILAGVGATWYTWLEQGRDVRASGTALRALAKALRLDETERRYLFELAGRPLNPVRRGAEREIAPSLLRMLQRLTNQPAYILDGRWDVLAWNRAAALLFGDYAQLDGDERNIMFMLFHNAEHRRLLMDWEVVAQMALGMFRAESVRHTGDPEYARLVEQLSAASPEFRTWWDRREIIRYTPIHKRIQHPLVGATVFEYNSFTSDDDSALKLVVYTPMDVDGTLEKMAELLAGTGGETRLTPDLNPRPSPSWSEPKRNVAGKLAV